MKRIVSIAICLLVVGLLMKTKYAVSKPDTYVIKFATLAPEGSTWMNVMAELNQSIMKKSNNQIKFQIYSGGVSGDEKDVIRKMRLGMLHSAGFTGNGLGEILPEVRVLELPFMFDNSSQIDYVIEKLDGYFSDAFDKKGYVLLGWAEVGFVNIFTNTPVESLQDLKRIKMWTWEGDPLASATFQACGITPIPLSFTEVLTSLQTGMIDGVYSSPLAIVALQWFTKVKYMIEPPMTNATGAVLINKLMFNKLPADLQTLLKEECRTHLRKLTELSRIDNQEAVKVLKKSGIKGSMLSSKGKGEAREVKSKISAELTGKLFPQELLDKTLFVLKEFNGRGSK